MVDDERSRRPVGVITDRDIACRTVAQGKNPLELTAGDCMTAECVTVSPDADVEDCCQVMEENQIRRVAVVDERGSCCGVVAQADIVEHVGRRETAEVVQEVSRPTEAASATNGGARRPAAANGSTRGLAGPAAALLRVLPRPARRLEARRLGGNARLKAEMTIQRPSRQRIPFFGDRPFSTWASAAQQAGLDETMGSPVV